MGFLWQPTNEKMPSDREPQKVECNKKPAPFGPLCHCKFWSFLYLWRRVTKIFSSVWFLIRFISINEITLCLDTNEIQPKCHQICSKFHLNLTSIYIFPGYENYMTWVCECINTDKTSQELRMLSLSLFIQRSQSNCEYCCSQLSAM